MTDADKAQFAEAFTRLAIALREQHPDARAVRVYFDALQGIEIEFVVEAATRLTRGEFFPKTGEWLREAQAVERERVEAQRALLRRLSTPLCEACDDTGWAHSGNGVTRCRCAAQRRLEVLGRRAWPALPAPADRVEERCR